MSIQWILPTAPTQNASSLKPSGATSTCSLGITRRNSFCGWFYLWYDRGKRRRRAAPGCAAGAEQQRAVPLHRTRRRLSASTALLCCKKIPQELESNSLGILGVRRKKAKEKEMKPQIPCSDLGKPHARSQRFSRPNSVGFNQGTSSWKYPQRTEGAGFGHQASEKPGTKNVA